MSKQQTTPFNGTPEQEEQLIAVIEKNKNLQGALIPILHEAQEIYGYLPREVQKIIAQRLDLPLSNIYGVVTFYSQFTLSPKGKFKIAVCLGTACYVKGSGDILNRIKEKINVDVGSCGEDGKFSLDATRCIGACGLAPVLTVNEDVYGRLILEDVEGIIAKYTNEE